MMEIDEKAKEGCSKGQELFVLCVEGVLETSYRDKTCYLFLAIL
jgi:hypothetical protein